MAQGAPAPAPWVKDLKYIVAGAGAGAITKTSIAPLERVKILFQIQGMHPEAPVKYKGIVGTLRTVVKEEGLQALYKGNGANVARIMPNYALKFAFNDAFKDMMRRPGQTNKELDFFQMIGAGTLAGFLQIFATYPMEVIRTRLSLSEGLSGGVKYKGILDCGVRSVREEGLLSMYKGFVVSLWSGAPYVGLQMTAFQVFKNHFVVEDGPMWKRTVSSLGCGALSGVIAQSITYPGDTIRRRLQTDGIGGRPKIYTGTLNAFATTVRTEGPRALYKGLGANIVRCIPGAAIQFWAYDGIKALLDI